MYQHKTPDARASPTTTDDRFYVKGGLKDIAIGPTRMQLLEERRIDLQNRSRRRALSREMRCTYHRVNIYKVS
jgi:hypothetical protein